MITKDELRRRVLVARYPRRTAAILDVAPDHKPLVLEDCPRCHGRGERCLHIDGPMELSECPECAGAGTTYAIVPYFSNTAPPETVRVDAAGWTTCACCAWRFSLRDAKAWTGLRHVRCGQRLVIDDTPRARENAGE